MIMNDDDDLMAQEEEEEDSNMELENNLITSIPPSDDDDEIEEEEETSSFKGIPLKEIPKFSSFPSLKPSSDWTIGVEIRDKIIMKPYESAGSLDDFRWWNDHYVRMPFSSQCLQPKLNSQTNRKELKSKWELIQKALGGGGEGDEIATVRDLEKCILSFNKSDRWSLKGLHEYFDGIEPEESSYFFENTLPFMQKLCLVLPQIIKTPLPLLNSGVNHSITLSQRQIASLLANAFFCTYPRRNAQGKRTEYHNYPAINFNRLFEPYGASLSQGHKLSCIFNYFRRRSLEKVEGGSNRLVTFSRKCIKDSEIPKWSKSEKKLSKLHISSEGTIEEDGYLMLQVDFANAFVGGGVLGHGCVQEEIRFLICPELIISRLFSEKLSDNECLIITGFEQYSLYSGYASTFEFKSNFKDETPIDTHINHRKTRLVAIDALKFRSDVYEQYLKINIDRELTKAYVGFYPYDGTNHIAGVATGNWGCGAFGGNPHLKSLIQIMAASQCGRDVAYFTFQQNEVEDEIFNMYSKLVDSDITVGQLYQWIIDYYPSNHKSYDLFTYLNVKIKDLSDKLQDHENKESTNIEPNPSHTTSSPDIKKSLHDNDNKQKISVEEEDGDGNISPPSSPSLLPNSSKKLIQPSISNYFNKM